MIWGEPEATYVRRFFDGVDGRITDEMQKGRSLLEESLTFVLARLLDGQSTFQRILDYPLDELNSDLDACGSGTQLSIEFGTNEHKRSFESAVSHADLGIVVRQDASVFGPSFTKAVIVQSKRLYPTKDRYCLRSAYDAFDSAQFLELKKLASIHGWGGVCYFLYNPRLKAFMEEDANIIGALEARVPSNLWLGHPFPFWHPEMEYILRKFGRRHPFGYGQPPVGAKTADELRQERNASVASRPGLRVLGITSLAEIVESGNTVHKSFRLEECYRYALTDHWFHNSGAVPFLPLSSYIVDLLLGCARGSTNENIVRIARGEDPEPPSVDSNEETPGLAVRHTMTITVRSTLPHNSDFHFHRQD